ncbi:T9SS type A sorting domain-containing protein [Spirosoma sp. KNUC1025]|uniref:T9SS type A sorting domain-containing protein n=1 Tax=Spirosoma sp. KNUC1025 TaxID=2894082 RepID=UPI0038631251|nr:T9SS type A sorting domain-containing protein [Spirosoma sp. KNUC1025]
MKTLIKSFALALSLSFVASIASTTEAKPIVRPTSAATYKTGVYTTVHGQLNIALDKEVGGAVDVRLKSADGQVLYSKHLGKKDQTYRTRLNLSDLEDGVYQLEITNGVETTTQNITLSTTKPSVPNRVIAVK